ncbi:cytochrome P450 [Xylaria sp. FL1777]|nr:cytochrome P450 [Xylaria sp. FL1777]
MWSLFTTAFGAVAVTYFFLQALLYLTQDAKEPPVIETAIPFVSPILGMGKRSSRYFNYLRDQYSAPVFTLRLPFARLYVITSPPLITAVQRQFRTLSFSPLKVRAVAKLAGPSQQAIDVISHNIPHDDSFLPGFTKSVYPALAGSMLDLLTERTVHVMLAEFDKLAARGSCTPLQMHKWTGELITCASSSGIYGPHNPLKDIENLSALNVYEAKYMTLVSSKFPQWYASDAIKAREYLAKKYEHYYAQGWHHQGSDFIQRRYAYMCESGLSPVDIAKIEVSGVFPLIGNTIPTAFWLIYHIFSSPIVLEDCRREVSQTVSEHNGVCTIDVSALKSSCPILFSTFQEVFRFHGMATSARVALEDHMLDGKYLIKKGGVVMISGRVQHSSTDNWGDDVDEFKHTRFIRSPGVKRHNPVTWRGFGGGTTTCPGRHFATTEVLLFAALLMLRFDVRLSDGRTQWVMPPMNNAPHPSALDLPAEDVKIELLPRPKQNWRAVFSKADKSTEIAAEDTLN